MKNCAGAIQGPPPQSCAGQVQPGLALEPAEEASGRCHGRDRLGSSGKSTCAQRHVEWETCLTRGTEGQANKACYANRFHGHTGARAAGARR